MNAQEARKITERSTKELKEAELAYALLAIKDRASIGRYTVKLSLQYDETPLRLHFLGYYTIETGKEIPEYEIRWDVKEL